MTAKATRVIRPMDLAFRYHRIWFKKFPEIPKNFTLDFIFRAVMVLRHYPNARPIKKSTWFWYCGYMVFLTLDLFHHQDFTAVLVALSVPLTICMASWWYAVGRVHKFFRWFIEFTHHKDLETAFSTVREEANLYPEFTDRQRACYDALKILALSYKQCGEAIFETENNRLSIL